MLTIDMSESERGRKIHAQAETAREKEQRFLKALRLLDEATICYAEDRDYLGMSEAQGSRFIVYKHLFEKSGDRSYLILATLSAQAAVEIAETNGIIQALALGYFNLGKAYEEMEEYAKAVLPFQKASEHLNNNPPPRHDRPEVKADIKAHLAFAEYMAGDKKALEKLEESISELENVEPVDEGNKYEIDVWLSGAYMRAARALREDNPKRAKEHLEKARKIIDSNPDLRLRLEQWKKLAETFS